MDTTLKSDEGVESVTVKCTDNSDLNGNPTNVHRFTGAEIRHSPDTTMAESWAEWSWWR